MRIFLPILWLMLIVLSFNTFSHSYEQHSHYSKALFWSKSSTKHPSNKNTQVYFLAEEFEENVEEDSDNESDIQFSDYDLPNTFNSNRFTPQFIQHFGYTLIAPACTSLAYKQAKFITYQNIRV